MAISVVPKYAVVSRGRFLVELGVALLLARLPIIGVPFNWLESYFHELSHALMTVLTGGQVSHIQLFVNGAGFCFSHGGAPILIGLSGYLGASLWGLLLYQLTLWPKGIRWCYSLMSLLVIGSAVLWARDSLTWLILVLLAGLFILPSRFANAAWLLMKLRIIALVVMLNAILSPLVLLQYDGQGDGQLLASLTWVPAIVWVCLWISVSIAAVYWCWRRIGAFRGKGSA